MPCNDSLTPVQRIRVIGPVLAACLGLVALTAWLLEWPIQKAVYLAPVIVVVYGIAIGLIVFWVRVAYLQVKASEHRRLILGVAVGLIGLVAILTLLGIELPREGG